MSLQDYKKKRNFEKTSEPPERKGKIASRADSSKKNRIFVVQEHWASHLHYDFRLEAFGTLKSWAVPKGPSLKVGDKRLAVEVEDHPIAYADFKGRIPKGQYGAGVVKIWDRGTWIAPKHLRENLEGGHLEFELKGRKLKGRWLLQRTKKSASGKNQWLLIKRHDKSAEAKPPRSLREQLVSSEKNKRVDPWPEDISPQLAKLSKTIPMGKDWIHEFKWDGYRTLVKVLNGRVEFQTRKGLDWSETYSFFSKDFLKLKVKSAVFDGEFVTLDSKGRPSFSDLQDALKTSKFDRSLFYIFDLLYLDGHDLRDRTLEDRKFILREVLKKSSPRIQYSEHWLAQGEELLQESCQRGLEGIVSKDRKGSYREGRSDSWQKVKCDQRQELVVGGYTDPAGERAAFGALLLGTYENGRLRYRGRVGTGFNSSNLTDILEKMKSLETENSPFQISAPAATKSIHWLKPKLVAEIAFHAITREGTLRHSVFKGFREDKAAREVAWEEEASSSGVREGKLKKRSVAKMKDEPSVKLSHPDRMIFPREKITKLDVANYYKSVAPWFLELSGGRPLSLLRCPDEAGKNCFFQKHPHNANLTEISESLALGQKVISIDRSEGLLQLVQYGVIEFHAWQTHQDRVLRPDQIIFDLDPDEKISWLQVKEAALIVKDLLQRLDLKSFLKTTGGKGLHLHVPIRPAYSWEDLKLFAKSVAVQLVTEHPKLFTAKMAKTARGQKIFVDYLRNGFGATAIAPYSLRARERATAAVPVEWKEIKSLRDPAHFGLRSTLERLATQKRDPWGGYLKLQQKVKALDQKIKSK